MGYRFVRENANSSKTKEKRKGKNDASNFSQFTPFSPFRHFAFPPTKLMLMVKIHKLRGLHIQSLTKRYEHNRSLPGVCGCDFPSFKFPFSPSMTVHHGLLQIEQRVRSLKNVSLKRSIQRRRY